MAKCIKIQRKKTKICVGSLNRKVDISRRVLLPPLDPLGPGISDVDYNIAFPPLSPGLIVMANVESVAGQTIFDEIGIERVIDTRFYIRFFDGIESGNTFVHLVSTIPTITPSFYKIISIVNLDNASLFLQLNCALTGKADRLASKA